jgi:4-hydroxybenzoate polyprenyltransferase
MKGKIAAVAELIKFEHSIFALPFAMMALFLVYRGLPEAGTTVRIIIAMVSGRSASMAFNRIADFYYDSRNPRTAGRPLQKKKLSLLEAWIFTVLMSALFIFCAWTFNPLAFGLSFPALALLLGYSFTKRFTWLSHLVLGFCLGSAPPAVWIAVKGYVSPASLLFCAGVTFWVGGFDVLYSLQDYDFDRRQGLKSIPACFGIAPSLAIAAAFHGVAVLTFVLAGVEAGLGPLYQAGAFVTAIFLAYEHLVVRRYGLSRIDLAFFTVNGFVSIVFFLFAVADIFVFRG